MYLSRKFDIESREDGLVGAVNAVDISSGLDYVVVFALEQSHHAGKKEF